MIELINSKEIQKSLKHNKRQYLCGNLKLPQLLNAIPDDNVEVGITKYQKYTAEIAHYHTTCSEYQYVLSGATKFLNVESGKTFELKKGDFFIVRPNTKYYQKAKKGCMVLFFKFPGGNDKVIVELTESQKQWGEKY